MKISCHINTGSHLLMTAAIFCYSNFQPNVVFVNLKFLSYKGGRHLLVLFYAVRWYLVIEALVDSNKIPIWLLAAILGLLISVLLKTCLYHGVADHYRREDQKAISHQVWFSFVFFCFCFLLFVCFILVWHRILREKSIDSWQVFFFLRS